MSEALPTFPLKSIFHPTDFSLESEIAFIHALKLAHAAGAELRIMHVDSQDQGSGWQDFPHVRATLSRWGMLPDPSPLPDATTGLHIQKIRSYGKDTATSILQHLEQKPADLIVLATHRRDALTRLIAESIAEPVARRSGMMTLFVQASVAGFIRPDDGMVRLRHVLIPVDRVPSPQPAVDAAAALARVLEVDTAVFRLLHVGAEGSVPEVRRPMEAGWRWETEVLSGNVVEQILAAATKYTADLIVMRTQGHQGFLDALRGSTTEQVVHRAPCPVLAAPSPSHPD